MIEILENGEADAEQRIQAVFGLLKDESPEAFAALSKTLTDDPSPIVRHEAAYVLGEKGTEEAITCLIQSIKHDPNDFVVHEAALALGNTRDQRAKEVLEELLNHHKQDVIQTAQIALDRLQPIEITDAEKVILDLEQRPEDRIQASFLLMSEGSLKSVQVLLDALYQEVNPIVKHEIIFSLGETAADIVVPELCNIIEEGGNRFVVHEAALALATLGDLKAETAISSLLNHPNPDVAETAEIALLRLKS